MFKAKFFPTCSVLDCVSSKKGSYAWKSIIQAKHVIDLGRVWRVGNGDSILIRGDKCIPQVSESRIVSPVIGLAPDSKVRVLIDHVSHSWKSSLIDQSFLPFEAKKIKGIPLSLFDAQDQQVWLPSPNGEYTTRTGYQLLAQHDKNLLPNTSSGRGSSHLWKSIWDLKVPHKVRHLIWRAANEALPTLHNLFRRKVVKSAICPMCKADGEDLIHALWSCRRLLVIWETHAELLKITSQKFRCFADLWVVFLLKKGVLEVELVAVIFWLVWNRRNAERTGDAALEYHMIRARADSYLLEFKSAKGREGMVEAIGVQSARWRLPDPNFFKINFDGAVFSELDAAGLGVVIRDSFGSVVGSLAERVPLPNSVASVEALACRRALLFAKELGISTAMVEGDAELIIRALHCREVFHPEFGLVIQDCLVLAAEFQHCKFYHVRRLGNSVAHFLARSSKSSSGLQVWLQSSLEAIAPLVLRDIL